MSLHSLLFPAFKVYKAPHGVKQPPGNGNSQAQAAHITPASGIRLIEIILHLPQLGRRHADACITDVHNQIDPIFLTAVSHIDVNTALLGKFKRILQKSFNYMGNFLRISQQNRRNSGIHVKHQLQLMTAALYGRHGNHIIDHRSNSIGFIHRRKRVLHNFSIIENIVNLAGQPFASQFYRV